MANLLEFGATCKALQNNQMEEAADAIVAALSGLADQANASYEYDHESEIHLLRLNATCEDIHALACARVLRHWLSEYEYVFLVTEVQDQQLFQGLLIDQLDAFEREQLAEQIEQLQKRANRGRGIEVARSAAEALRSGHTQFAVSSVVNNWDKIRDSHAELANLMQASGMYDPDGIFIR